MLDPAIPAAAGRGHPVVVGVVGAAVQVAGGAAVVVAEEEGLGGLGDWVGGGPVHPDPHPDGDTDSNSKKAEITLTRGVDAKCNYLREV